MLGEHKSGVGAQDDYYLLRSDSLACKPTYLDDLDYRSFLSILGPSVKENDSVEVLAYCLTPNHFYLLLNQKSKGGINTLIHQLTAEYNKYFYNRHNVEDLLSEGDYQISKIARDDLLNSSCEIHLSTNDWINCEYSSIRAYLYDDTPEWLDKNKISKIYGSAEKYLQLLESK